MPTLQLRCAQMPASSSQQGGPLRPNPRLTALLQRMKASSTNTEVFSTTTTTTSQETTTANPEVSDESFLTPEEISSLIPEQAAFLVRKRKAAMGLGPVFPESSICPKCSGDGTHCCHKCNGTGFNVTDPTAEVLGEDGGEIRQLNGVINVQWLFLDGGPCWLCRGHSIVGCSDCGGSGIRGGVDRYTGD